MNLNQQSKKFEQELYSLINNSQLPAANIYYILKMAFDEIEKIYYGALNSAAIEETEEIKQDDLVQQRESEK